MYKLQGKTWSDLDNDFIRGFNVTGVGRDGKRFKQYHRQSFMALNINLWKGSVWGLSELVTRKSDGKKYIKRTLIKRVYN